MRLKLLSNHEMTRQLPYPGHSWSLSQHAVGLDPQTLYNFLTCAAPFEGQSSGYDEKITELMIAAGVLTANRRDGNADAWRDYQQLLAELGLIYSTKIARALTLTELGHMFLAGELGFAELIGIQALRYQYPNGQKFTIQARLRAALTSASVATPATLTEYQAEQGILLKPGTLVLRALLELIREGHDGQLTVSECQAFLIPCKTNRDWPVAVAEVIAHRSAPRSIDAIHRHSRRNIQDWFKLLIKSDFFDGDGASHIKLSQYGLASPDKLASYCDLQENIATFWIPAKFDIDERRGWFDFFGHLPYEAQISLRLDVAGDTDYLLKNYVKGSEDDEDDASPPDTAGVNLTPINLGRLGRDTSFTFSGDIEALVANLRRGAQKRYAKTLLHDRIILQLAQAFIKQGANVESDPNSIDLFAVWPDGNSAIFEIKTVTRRSLQGRLRTAIGQVEEYAYRRKLDGADQSDKVVVLNTEFDGNAWQTAFLTQELGIGLICQSTRQYSAFAPSAAKTKRHWAP